MSDAGAYGVGVNAEYLAKGFAEPGLPPPMKNVQSLPATKRFCPHGHSTASPSTATARPLPTTDTALPAIGNLPSQFPHVALSPSKAMCLLFTNMLAVPAMTIPPVVVGSPFLIARRLMATSSIEVGNVPFPTRGHGSHMRLPARERSRPAGSMCEESKSWRRVLLPWIGISCVWVSHEQWPVRFSPSIERVRFLVRSAT